MIRWTVQRIEDSMTVSEAHFGDGRAARAAMLRHADMLAPGAPAVAAHMRTVSLSTIGGGERYKEWIIRVRPLDYVRVVVEETEQGSLL